MLFLLEWSWSGYSIVQWKSDLLWQLNTVLLLSPLPSLLLLLMLMPIALKRLRSYVFVELFAVQRFVLRR